jgi:hypothetical protein
MGADATNAGAHLYAAECKSKIGNATLKAGDAITAAAAFQQFLDLAKPLAGDNRQLTDYVLRSPKSQLVSVLGRPQTHVLRGSDALPLRWTE